MKIFSLILFIIASNLYGQKFEVKKISDLEGNEKEMHALLLQSNVAYFKDTSDMRFFSTVNFKETEKTMIVRTHFYKSPTKNYYGDQRIRSATHYSQLTFEKVIELGPNEYWGGNGPASDRSVSKAITPIYSLKIHEPKRNSFRPGPHGNLIISSTSESPFFDDKYKSQAVFRTKAAKNNSDGYSYENELENTIYEYIYCCKTYAIVRKDRKYGIIAHDNSVIVPVDKEYIALFNQGLIITEDTTSYFYDPINKIKLSNNYNKITPWMLYNTSEIFNEFSKVHKNGFVTILDSNQNELLPLIYTKLVVLSKDDSIILRAHRNSKQVIIDFQSSKEISTLYDSLSLIRENFILVKDQNKFGFINCKDEAILQLDYDRIYNLDILYNNFAVKKGGKFALFNFDSLRLTSGLLYDSIRIVGDLIIVENNNKYGAFSQDCKEIIPIVYDKIEYDKRKDIYLSTKKKKIVTYTVNGAKIK